MTDTPDSELLAEFARSHSEAAFAALVERHLALVHSVALRHTAHAQHAQDITQAVFIILARKADKLSPKTVVPGWLYHTARLTAANFQRAETRRIRREQEVFMESTLDETASAPVWNDLAPHLDAAMAQLGSADRDALVLRFFEGRSLNEVGDALGASEEAAKKRVNRAVEKLRKFFTKRGVTLSATVLSAVIAENSVQAAPATLAKVVTATALAKGAAASTSTLTLVKGALKIMAWTKMKTAVAVGVGILFAAGTTTVIVEKAVASASDPSWANDRNYWPTNPRLLKSLPKASIFRETHFSNDVPYHIVWGQYKEPACYMAKNMDLPQILATAYEGLWSRMVLPADLPATHFDVMQTKTSSNKELRKALQEVIRQRLSLVAHYDTQVVPAVTIKRIKPSAPGIQAATGGNEFRQEDGHQIVLRNAHWRSFCMDLENKLGIPVIGDAFANPGDRYDIQLRWQSRGNETDEMAIKEALASQLGLELAPTNVPLRVLVVEKLNQ